MQKWELARLEVSPKVEATNSMNPKPEEENDIRRTGLQQGKGHFFLL